METVINRVLVIGKNYSTPLGVIRSLGKAGYTVDMLYISRKIQEADILKACKYLNKLLIVNEENDDKVLSVINQEYKEEKEKRVLFPTDDYSASFIDRYWDLLSNRFIMPHVIGDTVTRLMDKSVQSELAGEVGFQVAKGWSVNLQEPSLVIPTDITYPCFLKPLLSAKGGKVGITKCKTRAELEEKVLSMKNKDPNRSVLIQEFLNIVREYTIGGICSDQEIYIPALIRKTRIAQYNRGVTLSGILVGNQEIGDCYNLVVRYLRRVRYVGMFDFEVLETDQGYFFGELNLRCGGPSYSYFLGGINLPEMAVRTLCGEELDFSSLPAIRLGEEFINNKVAWEDYANNYYSKSEFKTLLSAVPITLLDDLNDMGPQNAFNDLMPKKYYTQRIKSTIKQFIPKPIFQIYKQFREKS